MQPKNPQQARGKNKNKNKNAKNECGAPQTQNNTGGGTKENKKNRFTYNICVKTILLTSFPRLMKLMNTFPNIRLPNNLLF
jgi:hypothetical protein